MTININTFRCKVKMPAASPNRRLPRHLSPKRNRSRPRRPSPRRKSGKKGNPAPIHKPEPCHSGPDLARRAADSQEPLEQCIVHGYSMNEYSFNVMEWSKCEHIFPPTSKA